jgi:putative membrane protein
MARAVVDILIRVAINAVALIAAVGLVPRVGFHGEWWQLLIVAAIFGVINAYLRPIVKLLSLPLNLLTFGAVGFVINTALLLLLALVSSQLRLGLTFAGWPTHAFTPDAVLAAFLASLVISVVSTLIALVRLITPRA